MNQFQSIRVTAVPRELSPGAAYHPICFGNKFKDYIVDILEDRVG